MSPHITEHDITNKINESVMTHIKKSYQKVDNYDSIKSLFEISKRSCDKKN